MSEKSTRNNLDYTVESRAARNRSVFRLEFQLCHTAEEPYNSSKSGLKAGDSNETLVRVEISRDGVLLPTRPAVTGTDWVPEHSHRRFDD